MFRSVYMVIITLAGVLAGVYYWDAEVLWWSLAIATYFVMSCLGITITFHRFLAHRSFEWKSSWLFRVFVLFGTLAGTGSPIGWVAVHKTHHTHSDTDADPHGPHLGWRNFVPDYDGHVNYMTVRSLLGSPYLYFLHNYASYVIIAYWLVLWGIGGMQLVAFMGLIPQALTIIMSVVSNYFSHKIGYRNYKTDDHSFNNWWLALPTWGESWHNNHHAKPARASFSEKWWEIDISGLLIHLLAKRGTIN